jgi:hypothetical protein
MATSDQTMAKRKLRAKAARVDRAETRLASVRSDRDEAVRDEVKAGLLTQAEIAQAAGMTDARVRQLVRSD